MGKIKMRWVEGKMMVGSDSNGHSIVIGRSPDPDFVWAGIKPSDLLLMSVASCAAFDVVEILQKQRQQLEDLKITCQGEQLSDPPYTFTSIHLHYLVKGQVEDSRLEKAIQLSEEKYCSVISTLRPGVPVTSDYEIIPD